MKLDRDVNGVGKYALVKIRELPGVRRPDIVKALMKGFDGSFRESQIEVAVDFGSHPDSEFFVIRMKDKYAGRVDWRVQPNATSSATETTTTNYQ